jgi:hypothetical protein
MAPSPVATQRRLTVTQARRLDDSDARPAGTVTFGVFAPCDPRIDDEARVRAGNIVRMVADRIA